MACTCFGPNLLYGVDYAATVLRAHCIALTRLRRLPQRPSTLKSNGMQETALAPRAWLSTGFAVKAGERGLFGTPGRAGNDVHAVDMAICSTEAWRARQQWLRCC